MGFASDECPWRRFWFIPGKHALLTQIQRARRLTRSSIVETSAPSGATTELASA